MNLSNSGVLQGSTGCTTQNLYVLVLSTTWYDLVVFRTLVELQTKLYSRDRACEDCEKSKECNMKTNQTDCQDISIRLISNQNFVFVVNPRLGFIILVVHTKLYTKFIFCLFMKSPPPSNENLLTFFIIFLVLLFSKLPK